MQSIKMTKTKGFQKKIFYYDKSLGRAGGFNFTTTKRTLSGFGLLYTPYNHIIHVIISQAHIIYLFFFIFFLLNHKPQKKR